MFGVHIFLDKTDSMQRTLILIGKVIQTIANQREFGAKEDFMKPLNILMEVRPQMVNFLVKKFLRCEIFHAVFLWNLSAPVTAVAH